MECWTQVKNLPKHKTSITLVRKAVCQWEVKMEIFPVKGINMTHMYQFNKSSKFRQELNKENTLLLTSLFVNKTGGQPSGLCSVTGRGLLPPAFLAGIHFSTVSSVKHRVRNAMLCLALTENCSCRKSSHQRFFKLGNVNPTQKKCCLPVASFWVKSFLSP